MDLAETHKISSPVLLFSLFLSSVVSEEILKRGYSAYAGVTIQQFGFDWNFPRIFRFVI